MAKTNITFSMPRFDKLRPQENKNQIRQNLQRDTARFLRAGGNVNQLPSYVSEPKQDSKELREMWGRGKIGN